MSDIQSPEGRTVAEIRRAPLVVQDDVTFLFDTARFEQLQRLAGVMAACRTMPAHLKGSISDCFRVASQAMRWQMDPFAICDKTYEVGGKLAYEGQLIAAVVNLRAGLEGRLSYRYSGDPTQHETLSVTVAGKFRGEAEERTIGVTWKAGFAMSKGARDKWQSQPEQQLSYFGARVWARRHCPEIILGAYTPEELFDDQQIAPPRDVTPRTGGKLAALESLANPEGHREGNDATTAETSPAAPEDETFNSASTAVRPSQETRRSAERDGSQGNAPPAGASGLPSHTNSPAAQPVHERNTDGSGGPASAGEPDQSASRPDAPPPVAGRPGADATLPAGLAPVEDASRRGDGPAPAGEATLDQWQGEVDMMASELGQSLGAAADERLTSHGLALGNRRNAANVSMRPQSDLLAERGEGSARPFATTDTAPSGGDGGSGDNRTRGGSGPTATTPASRSDLLGAPPAENLTVPLPARPTVGQLADFAQEVLLRIADAPPTPQRIALIKKQNEHGIGLLRAAAPEQYNEVQAALAMRAT